MTAHLTDSPLIEDNNLVGIANGAEAVGDDDECAGAKERSRST